MFKSVNCCYTVSVFCILLCLSACSKQSANKNASYGELSEYRSERVYLLLACELFAAYAPYSNAKGHERETLTFQAMEANMQLNLVRIKYVLDKEILSENTRRILSQSVSDCRLIYKKNPPVYRVWADAGKVYDLGTSEPVLPRHFPVYDILVE